MLTCTMQHRDEGPRAPMSACTFVLHVTALWPARAMRTRHVPTDPRDASPCSTPLKSDGMDLLHAQHLGQNP